MSPASRSKSKDKRAAAKEPQKSSNKTTTNSNSGSGAAASGYNPLLGTFHALDINGHTDDHTGTALGIEYDSLSNNGSWSGESEDHKEKTSSGPSRHEPSPGVDNDKREKIRQKNEKKHQRQKERRAQELHERCSGYLMSRKLEALAQQLVAMGFSSERATMALILNEGRVEQSVAWLFDGGEDSDHHAVAASGGGTGHLKIDISEELAQITEMEIKFKCSKQEVERAVVGCEGDLVQAAETLKSQKHEPPAAPPQPPAAPPKAAAAAAVSEVAQNNSRIQKQKTDDKDFNYTKMVTIGPPPSTEVKSLQLLKKIPATTEKRWPVPVAGGSAATAPPPKTELKNLQLGSVREPVIVMQRPKSKPVPTVSSSSSEWHPTVTNINPNGFSHSMPSYGTTVNTQTYDPFHFPHQHSLDHHFSQQGGITHFNNSGSVSGIWNRMGGGGGGSTTTTTTPTLAAASSLGLFTGSNGSSGPSSPVDWNVGDSSQFDYANIDWSLDRIPVPPTRPNGMWMSPANSTEFYSPGRNVMAAMRPPPEVAVALGSEVGSGGGSREWSSPFEEKELFSFPRQFVSSPSL